jgi:pimeloyl-ACP methyl ester carboxylesterase
MATFLLVPGAWLGGWCWQRVTPGLRAEGHEVFTMTLSGLGERVHLGGPQTDLDTRIQDVVNLIEFEDLHDVLLLGHSYSGFVVTGVADRVSDRIRHLIYLDAAVPSGGTSMFEEAGPEFAQFVEQIAGQQGDGWRWPIPPAEMLAQNSSLAGIDEANLRWFYDKARPHPVGTLRQPLRLERQGTPPFARTYISCTAERVSEPPRAEHARTSPDWGYHQIDTGHWPMFSTPDRIAALLNEIAAGT